MNNSQRFVKLLFAVILGLASFKNASMAQSPGGIITAPRVWYKADYGINAADGQPVTAWNPYVDNTGLAGGYILTQNNSLYQPVYYNTNTGKLVNFNPALGMAESASAPLQALENSSTLMPDNLTYTIFCVALDTSTTIARALCVTTGLNTATGNINTSIGKEGGSGFLDWFQLLDGTTYHVTSGYAGTSFSPRGGPNGYYDGSVPPNLVAPSIATMQAARPQIAVATGPGYQQTGLLRFYIDGVVKQVSSNFSQNTTGLYPGLSVGASMNLSNSWKGKIAEVIVFGSQQTLSDDDINKVGTYLAIKYGITLGTGGGDETGVNRDIGEGIYDSYINSQNTYLWRSDINKEFSYNIAGIARDDASALNQKQSRSVNSFSPGQLTIALGNTVAPTNAANTTGFSNNLSALMWGDNGDKSSYLSSTTGTALSGTKLAGTIWSGASTRMNRIWQFQRTNFTANDVVTVQTPQNFFDPSLLSGDPYGKFYMLVSSDPNFNAGSSIALFPLSTSGNNYTCSFYPSLYNSAGTGFYVTFAYLTTGAPNPVGISAFPVVWYKADYGILLSGGGQSVQSWSPFVDNTGTAGGYILTQNTPANEPLFYSSNAVNKLLNFNPTLGMDEIAADGGTPQYLTNINSLMDDTSKHTVFCVAMDTSAFGYSTQAQQRYCLNAGFYGVGKFNINVFSSWFQSMSNLNYFISEGASFSPPDGSNTYYNGTQWIQNTPATQQPARPQIAAASGGGYQNPALSISYLDGVKGSYTTPSSSNFPDFYGGSSYGGLSIGAASVGTAQSPWHGRIPEVIVFNSQLSDADVQKINSYLAIKYGITLNTAGGDSGSVNRDGNPANEIPTEAGYYLNSLGTAIWNTDDGDGYNYNIAGIARDDASFLYQKQSRSVNAHPLGQLTAAIGGSVAANNLLNRNSLSNNLSSVVWGDNGDVSAALSLSTGASLSGASLSGIIYNDLSSRRMKRIWQFQEWGLTANDPVTIQIPQSWFDPALLSDPCGQAYMLVSKDGNFNSSSTVTAYPLSASGGNFTCTILPYNLGTGIASHRLFYAGFAFLSAGTPGKAYLPPANINGITTDAPINISATSNCAVQNGWTYYYADTDINGIHKLYAVDWNSNSQPNAFSGAITVNQALSGTNAKDYPKSSGSNQDAIVGRSLQLIWQSGSFVPFTKDIKLRMYYSPAEINNAISHVFSPSRFAWFMHSGDINSAIKDNTGGSILHAVFYNDGSPAVTYGGEDGVPYAEITVPYTDINDMLGSGQSSPTDITFGYIVSNSPHPLPVTIDNFTAKATNCEAIVSWTGTAENNFAFYTVQHSTSGAGNSFADVQQIPGKGSGSSYTAQFAMTANNEYIRLKMTDNSGNITYSNTLSISSNCASGAPVLYPNPVSNQLTIGNMGAGSKTIRITSASGAVVYTNVTQAQQINVSAQNWAAGIYLVSIQTAAGTVNTMKVVKHE
ncbi:MAG: T9SS type A sorting domain-containing protein [Chitinophagaceae bacterium]|jgi:hypothetical protein|nr:T9SS type A sorting domain-containing protein [Chitinophagaceae bacterium]